MTAPTISRLYGKNPVNAIINNKPGEALFGVELEIEGIVVEAEDCCGKWTMVKEDGSLRNNGWEYVTYPLHYADVVEEVADVLRHFQDNTEEHFSERTSCHVHLNVGDMDLSQLAALLLAYQVTERLLFDFVGGSRDKNIFCVPLSECVTSYQAARRLNAGQVVKVVDGWRKYTALNLSRLPDIQTVEFRHMPGTPDVAKIFTWIGMIKSLRDFAIKTTYDDLVNRINTLNTSSMYMAFAVDVLGGGINLPWWNYQQHAPMMEEGVLTAKYSLLDMDKIKPSTFRWGLEPLRPNELEQQWVLLREEINQNAMNALLEDARVEAPQMPDMLNEEEAP